MKIKKPLIIGVVAGLALSTFAMVTPAFADPVTDGYVAVGSDTLQDSMNALTNGTKVTGSSVRVKDTSGTALGNFDAFGSAKIQTKSGGPFFVRPAGSGNGREALIASITGGGWNGVDIAGQVDIARSSSGPGNKTDAAGDLAYVPYGRDAVSYAYNGPAADLGSLTSQQLHDIYAGTLTHIGNTDILPMIPQSGSGTRSFFLGAIGVSTLGSNVSSNDDTLAENDARVLTTVGQIVPFSAASWVAQANGAAPSTLTADTAMGSIDGVAAFTGTGSSLTPSATFYGNSTFGRDVYLIVEYARIDSNDPKYDPKLAALVNPTNVDGLTNFTATFASKPASVKRKFGFQSPSSTSLIRAYPNVY